MRRDLEVISLDPVEFDLAPSMRKTMTNSLSMMLMTKTTGTTMKNPMRMAKTSPIKTTDIAPSDGRQLVAIPAFLCSGRFSAKSLWGIVSAQSYPFSGFGSGLHNF